ncbi:HutD family protein [Desnuesiella massiliensis]|uniref:HutD/Ves family protein n=1 Tax=Desnuesiella massiliensis TaxID=1650662 RepID=UPI0006E21FF7|nr:HutD family protein [Desnuesiella massiliensis]
MSYTMKVIRKEELFTGKWSGGTTTELLIYPEDAKYSHRNFKWRISSAKVEIEESIFTHLPGIERVIMVLEGELELHHEGHHSIKIKEFQKDRFSGDWITKSYGMVTDFNLMMSSGCRGELHSISLPAGQVKEIHTSNFNEKDFSNITEVFYCVGGVVDIFVKDNANIYLNKGDLLQITRESASTSTTLAFSNNNQEEVKLIKTVVYYS